MMNLLGFWVVGVLGTDELWCNETVPRQMMCVLPEGFPEADCNIRENESFNCTVNPSVRCKGERTFSLSFPCQYCYQSVNIECEPQTDCVPGIGDFSQTCWSSDYCMGYSLFQRRAQCQRTSKSQLTAILLSLFVGGFGADRFYLGHYVSAVFKMLTFGGLGIAYFADFLLICMGYLGPADGSLYAERV